MIIPLALFFFLVFPAFALGDELESDLDIDSAPTISEYLETDLTPDPEPAISIITDPEIIELLPEGVDPASVQRFENVIVENLILQPESNSLEDEAEYMLLSDLDIDLVNLPTDNCVVYQGRFNNQTCYLIFPASATEQLTTSETGILLNVSSSNVVGRLFYSDNFSATDYRYNIFTIYPCLTSTGAQQIYRNGACSYLYTYTGNTQTTNIYGNFVVEDQLSFVSHSVDYNNQLLLIGILLFVGADSIFNWLRIAKN